MLNLAEHEIYLLMSMKMLQQLDFHIFWQRNVHAQYVQHEEFAIDSFLIELGFNDTSTLVGHFVSSPREREKKDRRDSKGDEREGQGRKRNRNE